MKLGGGGRCSMYDGDGDDDFKAHFHLLKQKQVVTPFLLTPLPDKVDYWDFFV